MARVLFFSELFGKIAAVVVWSVDPWSAWGALLFFGVDVFVFYHLFVPSAQWLCPVVTRFETTKNEVWLTIDDGPDVTDTPRILDLLDQHDARATFFVVGERTARWPHLVSEIIRRGHEIGHHTHTHPAATFWCASRKRLNRELDDALAALKSAGVRPHWFRPPVGIKNFFLASSLRVRKLHCVGWTVRSGDCLADCAEKVVGKVMRHIQPGAILLLHEGISVPASLRVRTISLLLESLTARNVRCVLPAWQQLRPRLHTDPRSVAPRHPTSDADPVAVGE